MAYFSSFDDGNTDLLEMNHALSKILAPLSKLSNSAYIDPNHDVERSAFHCIIIDKIYVLIIE
jgi:hypothetical protein